MAESGSTVEDQLKELQEFKGKITVFMNLDYI